MEEYKKIWCNFDTLLIAFETAKKRKSYHKTVLRYEANLAENLEKLLVRLDQGTYRPAPYREFYVYDPKERLIQAPYFEDRIVHHALLYAIRYPIEKRLIYDTYACRELKGTQRASNQLLRYIRAEKGEGYALKVDVRKFFYRIDHERIDSHVARIISCHETRGLLKLFYYNQTGKGLPLGNVTSQLLANLALNPVDHLIKRQLKVRHYVRYMDDMILLHPDREFLKDSLGAIERYLNEEKLETNKRTGIQPIAKGLNFVGYHHTKYGKRLTTRNLHKFRRVLKKKCDRTRTVSYLAFAKDTTSYDLLCNHIEKQNPKLKNTINAFTQKHRKAV